MIKDIPESGRNDFREDIVKEEQPEQDGYALKDLDIEIADDLKNAYPGYPEDRNYRAEHQ